METRESKFLNEYCPQCHSDKMHCRDITTDYGVKLIDNQMTRTLIRQYHNKCAECDYVWTVVCEYALIDEWAIIDRAPVTPSPDEEWQPLDESIDELLDIDTWTKYGSEDKADDVKLDNILSMSYVGSPQIVTTAEKAYSLHRQGLTGVYFSIAYWGDLPAGFTQFTFNDDQPELPDILHVLKMNRQDTAIDKPSIVRAGDWVIVQDVDIVPGADVYHLKQYTKD